MRRTIKEEKTGDNVDNVAVGREAGDHVESDEAKRRVLRSKYLAVMTKINDARDDISSVDSNKFNTIINEVDNLHQQVSKPREQVADAGVLLDLANMLVTCVKSISCEGISPADFVNGFIREFGKSNRSLDSQETELILINWKNMGMAVSPFFATCKGICTMLGPMKNELKKRKCTATRTRAVRVRPTHTARPEEVDDKGADEKTDTDKNMATMFEILRNKRQVKLESLILNRSSFAQTVENLFALSFLVKDGRAEIVVDESGFHIVSPKNAPGALSVTKGEVAYRHFVFRFDFQDWKLMAKMVPIGEEVMSHREESQLILSRSESAANNSEGTPIRKLPRNRGLVLQESIDGSAETDDVTKGPDIRKCRRKLNLPTDFF